jgi:hypothetical protein
VTAHADDDTRRSRPVRRLAALAILVALFAVGSVWIGRSVGQCSDTSAIESSGIVTPIGLVDRLPRLDAIVVGQWHGSVQPPIDQGPEIGSARLDGYTIEVSQALDGSVPAGELTVVDWVSRAGDEQGQRLCDNDTVVAFLDQASELDGSMYLLEQVARVNGESLQFVPVDNGSTWQRELQRVRTTLNLNSDRAALELIISEIRNPDNGTPALDVLRSA